MWRVDSCAVKWSPAVVVIFPCRMDGHLMPVLCGPYHLLLVEMLCTFTSCSLTALLG